LGWELGYRPTVVIRGFLFAVFSGTIAIFLANWITNYLRYSHDGLLFMPESRDIFWTLLGGGIAALIYIRKINAPLGRVLDQIAPALPLAQAIGRLGCTAAGCCFGIITDSWLGVYMPDDQGYWAMRYPTQPIAAVADFLIFIILLILGRSGKSKQNTNLWRFDGFLALLYILLFSIKRFILAYFRQEGTIPMCGPLSWMHLNALTGGLFALVLIVWNIQRNKKEAVPT
jgi:phosphatidylglycerol:prolipoprotein diacylglycerol transferase